MSSALLEPRNGSALASSDEFDLFADLRKELEELSVANRQILDELRTDPAISFEGAPSDAPVYTAAQWDEREQAHQEALEEKSETIRKLEAELEKIREEGLPELPPEEIHDATVKRLQKQLEDRRKQLDEDEENMMRQLRAMELALAKDRADLARQRAEFQRLHDDFQRDLEHARRDSDLRDRLLGFQRRPLDGQGRRVSDPELAHGGPVSVDARARPVAAAGAPARQAGQRPVPPPVRLLAPVCSRRCSRIMTA
jgi:DNA repair exonuclease SbcCD ATPase subunit